MRISFSDSPLRGGVADFEWDGKQVTAVHLFYVGKWMVCKFTGDGVEFVKWLLSYEERVRSPEKYAEELK